MKIISNLLYMVLWYCDYKIASNKILKVKTWLPWTTIKSLESHKSKCAYNKSIHFASVSVYFAKQYWIQNRKPPCSKNILILFVKKLKCSFYHFLYSSCNRKWLLNILPHLSLSKIKYEPNLQGIFLKFARAE